MDASKSEISDLMAQIEAANRQQKQQDQSNNEAVAKTNALQLEIDGLINLKTEIEVANHQLKEALTGKFEAEATIKALQSEIIEPSSCHPTDLAIFQVAAYCLVAKAALH